MTRAFALFLLTFLMTLAACSGTEEIAEPRAETAKIAVATNFKPVMDQLKDRFEAETRFRVEIVSGSTGALYTQITQGAPFDLFLAADQARPKLLETDGLGVIGRRGTYAIGLLAYWQPDAVDVTQKNLSQQASGKLAIANPALAPYGRAATEVLAALNVTQAVQARLVLGENVGQAFTFVRTRNAEAGFVALSQIRAMPKDDQSAYWLPPQDLYAPIKQDAILLRRGADNEAATGFFRFLSGQEAREIISNAGYQLP